MRALARLLAFTCGAGIVDAAPGRAGDPLRAALEASRTTGRGLTLYVNGAAVPVVVVSVDDAFVVGRSNAQGDVVVRLDRIDGVAGFLGPGARAP